jgi:hypothetical protein
MQVGITWQSSNLLCLQYSNLDRCEANSRCLRWFGASVAFPFLDCMSRMHKKRKSSKAPSCRRNFWRFALGQGARENESHVGNDWHHLDSAGFQQLFRLLNGRLNIILEILDRTKLSQRDTEVWLFRTNTFKLINDTS